MMSRIGIIAIGLFFPLCVCAQEWTKSDSIRLKRILEGDGELLLNPEAVRSIEFESVPREFFMPLEITDSPAMKFNEDLPGMEKRPVRLSLRPYNIHTKWNEDPFHAIAGKPDQRQMAMGMKFNLEKLYNSLQIGNVSVYGIAEKGRVGPEKTFAYAGVGVGGLDLMAPFTKGFWKKKQKGPHAWETYGDSTTVLIREAVYKLEIIENK